MMSISDVKEAKVSEVQCVGDSNAISQTLSREGGTELKTFASRVSSFVEVLLYSSVSSNHHLSSFSVGSSIFLS